MSAKTFSRDFAAGKVKHLQRMQQPVALTVLRLEALPVRNPVARALAQRSLSSAAGKHIRSSSAMRRADNVALHKALPRLLRDE
ncbi:MAG: hypothetical protein HC765_09260 [Brachymonas sp.]|nr:hypothetical protein [Brachymonas sp.]